MAKHEAKYYSLWQWKKPENSETASVLKQLQNIVVATRWESNLLLLQQSYWALKQRAQRIFKKKKKKWKSIKISINCIRCSDSWILLNFMLNTKRSYERMLFWAVIHLWVIGWRWLSIFMLYLAILRSCMLSQLNNWYKSNRK